MKRTYKQIDMRGHRGFSLPVWIDVATESCALAFASFRKTLYRLACVFGRCVNSGVYIGNARVYPFRANENNVRVGRRCWRGREDSNPLGTEISDLGASLLA